jgi:hypothetical protein
MGKCIKCGRETKTQYECYSTESEEDKASDYQYHKDYFCNKCVLGLEWLKALIVALVSCIPLILVIFLVAMEVNETILNAVLFFSLFYLIAVVSNFIWFFSVVKSLITGREHMGSAFGFIWIFGLFFGDSIDFDAKVGVVEYIKHLYAQMPNKEFTTKEGYLEIKKEAENYLLQNPASLLIKRNVSSFNDITICLNGNEVASIKNGKSVKIDIKMKNNVLDFDYSGRLFEFEAKDGGIGEIWLISKGFSKLHWIE